MERRLPERRWGLLLSRRLWNRNFFLLWQGQLVSQVGSAAFGIAALFWVKHTTGSATLMGLILMLINLPGVFLGPIGGTFADHHSRRLILVWCDVLSGAAMLAVGSLFWLELDAQRVLLPALVCAGLVLGAIGAFFRPAVGAALPDLVPEDSLAAANAMNGISLQSSQILGQGAGGLLYVTLGAPLLLLFDGLTYLFSAFSESFIRIEEPHVAASPRGQALERFLTDLKEGLAYVWSVRGLRQLFIASAALNFFINPIAVLLPFFVEDTLGADAAWYGYIMGSLAAGSLAGFLVSGSVSLRARGRVRLVVAMMISEGVLLVLLSGTRTVEAALVVMILVGATASLVNVNLTTVLQLATPAGIRGRVLGLLMTVAMGLTPIAMGLSGVVADVMGGDVPLLFSVCGAIVTAVSVTISTRREFRAYVGHETGEAAGRA